MDCPRCREKHIEDANFCPRCGLNLSSFRKPFLVRHKKLFIGILILIFFFILPFVVFSLLVVSSIGKIKEQTQEEAVISGSGIDKIALVNIDGVIVENAPTTGISAIAEEFTSARKIKKILKDLSSQKEVKALLLRINSPGGSAVASEEIYRDILSFKKSSGRKVVAYFSDLAASGGYYVAMASDSIIANPSTITGSIGVVISYLNFQELAEKYGVKQIVYKTGAFKDSLNEFKKPTKEEEKIIQGVIDDSFDAFIRAVSTGRKLSEGEVKKLADGRIYSAAQAKQLNLVDKVGTLDDAIQKTKDIAGLREASVVEVGQPGFWEVILGNMMNLRFNLSILPHLGNLFEGKPGIRILYLYTL